MKHITGVLTVFALMNALLFLSAGKIDYAIFSQISAFMFAYLNREVK